MTRPVCPYWLIAVGFLSTAAWSQPIESALVAGLEKKSSFSPRPARQRVSVAGPGWAWAAKAYRSYDQKRFAAAATEAERAVTAEPRHVDYRTLHINALLAAGRSEAAMAAVRDALSTLGSREVWLAAERELLARQAVASAEKVYQAIQHGDLSLAAASASQAVHLAPAKLEYRRLLIDVLTRQASWSAAEAASTDALLVWPADANLLAWRAVARSAQGLHGQALADLEAAVALPSLGDVQHRWLRLMGVDLALRGNHAAVAKSWLAHSVLDTASDEEWMGALASRRAAVEKTMSRSNAVLNDAPIAMVSPVLRCLPVPQGETCFLVPGAPAADAGYADAEEGYRRFQAGDWALAEESARRAVALSPNNVAYTLLLVDSLERGEKSAAALSAANDGLKQHPLDPGLMLKQVRLLGAVSPPGLRLALSRLMELGKPADLPDPELAYLALKADDDALAQQAFQRADEAGQLSGQAYGDAAFTALRLKLDRHALSFFAKGVDALGTLARDDSLSTRELAAEQVQMYRQATAEVSRTWGVTASLTLSRDLSFSANTGLGARALARSTVSGLEWYGRPLGYRNGQRFEVFAKGYATLHNSLPGPTGWGSGVASAGVRWQPYPASPVVLSFWHQMPLGTIGEPDWLAQAAYFEGWNTDVRAEKTAWWSTQLAGEWTRSIRFGQTYASLEGRVGRAHKRSAEETAWAFWPFASLKLEHDTQSLAVNTQGLDVGITLKRAFRQDVYTAPMSTFEVEWRHRVKQWGGGQAGSLIKLSTSY